MIAVSVVSHGDLREKTGPGEVRENFDFLTLERISFFTQVSRYCRALRTKVWHTLQTPI